MSVIPPEPDFDWEDGDAFSEDNPITAYYSQDPQARLNLPFSCDCSGLVWWHFDQLGLADVMFSSSDAGVSEHIEWFEACHWRQADLLLRWNENSPGGEAQTTLARQVLNDRHYTNGVEDPSKAFLQKGDLLYRCDSPSGEGDHVCWFTGWEDEASTRMRIFDAHPLSNPVVGDRVLNYDYVVSTFTHAVRPRPIGYGMWYRYGAAVPKAV